MICIRHENGKLSIHFTTAQASKLRDLMVAEANRLKLKSHPGEYQDSVRVLTDFCDALAAPVPPVLLKERHHED